MATYDIFLFICSTVLIAFVFVLRPSIEKLSVIINFPLQGGAVYNKSEKCKSILMHFKIIIVLLHLLVILAAKMHGTRNK